MQKGWRIDGRIPRFFEQEMHLKQQSQRPGPGFYEVAGQTKHAKAENLLIKPMNLQQSFGNVQRAALKHVRSQNRKELESRLGPGSYSPCAS